MNLIVPENLFPAFLSFAFRKIPVPDQPGDLLGNPALKSGLDLGTDEI